MVKCKYLTVDHISSDVVNAIEESLVQESVLLLANPPCDGGCTDHDILELATNRINTSDAECRLVS